MAVSRAMAGPSGPGAVVLDQPKGNGLEPQGGGVRGHERSPRRLLVVSQRRWVNPGEAKVVVGVKVPLSGLVGRAVDR